MALSLVGTSAENIRHSDYRKVIFLIIVNADEPALGVSPQYYSTRSVTISGHVYEDRLLKLTFERSYLPWRGGLAPVGGCKIAINNAGILSGLIDNYFLENDTVEVYAIVDDGSITDTDRIPLAWGVITDYPVKLDEWILDVVDGTDQDWRPIPVQRIQPQTGNSFEYAPLDEWGKAVPISFGALNISPYDDVGIVQYLAPCRCTNFYLSQYTAGLHNKTYGTAYQWYPQAGVLASISAITQSGGYFTIDTATRALWLRPAFPEGTNTVSNWSAVADGKTATVVTLAAVDTLYLYFQGVTKLGTLSANPSLEIKASGSYTYTVRLGTSILAGPTGDVDDASISLNQSNWVDDWDFEALSIEITTASTPSIKEIYLVLTYSDQSAISAQRGLTIFQAIQGFEDQVAKYNSTGASNPLITGGAGTLITNPVDCVEAILRTKDLLNLPVGSLDLASFDTARLLRTAWTFAFSLYEIENNISFLSDICQEAGLFLYRNAQGKWRIVARDTGVTPVHTFLDQWNIAVSNPADSYENYRSAFDFKRQENRQLISEFAVFSQHDRATDSYNLMSVASSSYRLVGNGNLSSITDTLTWTGGTFITGGAEVGDIVYADGDQDYRVIAVTSNELLSISPVSGGDVSTLTGRDFWVGPNLSEPALRARRRYKTLNALGTSQSSFRELGGYEARFIRDAATATEFLTMGLAWDAFLPIVVHTQIFIGHLDVELGDQAFFDHPWLPATMRPIVITSLAAGINNSALTMTVTTGTGGMIREGDWLLLRDNPRQPEVVKVSTIVNDTVTVISRGTAGTKGYAHANLTALERFETKWIVVGLQPPDPESCVVTIDLAEVPIWYAWELVIAPDATPDWASMTAAQQAQYRAIATESGLIIDRDSSTTQVIAED